MAHTHQFCTFYLAHICFGLDVKKVQEVIRYQSITRVPLAPPAVRGLINLRGQIVPAIDLRQCLDISESDSTYQKSSMAGSNSATSNLFNYFFPSLEQLPLNAIVQADDEVISLLVDEVGEVLEISDCAFEPPPETLKGKARELIKGAYKLNDLLLLILDTEKVFEVSKISD
ncbi:MULTISPECIES: chemotaxis protein CheW [Aerosakkonema]|uniref:chemotaxis protein CheW n=1 Tax=Aerosakkonema TaxID=1246629 RepID=UPI0035BB85FA